MTDKLGTEFRFGAGDDTNAPEEPFFAQIDLFAIGLATSWSFAQDGASSDVIAAERNAAFDARIEELNLLDPGNENSPSILNQAAHDVFGDVVFNTNDLQRRMAVKLATL